MKNLLFTVLLLLGISLHADADIWRWVDANGDVHFVNTKTPIYTWVDSYGLVQFADTPKHEDAVSVDLVWHSEGDDIEEAAKEAKERSYGSAWASADETAEERLERENAAKYYCRRAQEIYDSYLAAPRLYETNADGEKVYLTEEQAATKIAETRAAVEQACN